MKKITIGIMALAFLGGCSMFDSGLAPTEPCVEKKRLAKMYCKMKYRKANKEAE